MTVAAFSRDLSILQGETFAYRAVWKTGPSPGVPVDLTGCVARMQVRSSKASEEVLIALTTENDRIALGGTDGSIELGISAADTAALDRGGVYDLEIEFPDGTVRRLLQGKVRFDPEVTRDA